MNNLDQEKLKIVICALVILILLYIGVRIFDFVRNRRRKRRKLYNYEVIEDTKVKKEVTKEVKAKEEKNITKEVNITKEKDIKKDNYKNVEYKNNEYKNKEYKNNNYKNNEYKNNNYKNNTLIVTKENDYNKEKNNTDTLIVTKETDKKENNKNYETLEEKVKREFRKVDAEIEEDTKKIDKEIKDTSNEVKKEIKYDYEITSNDYKDYLEKEVSHKAIDDLSLEEYEDNDLDDDYYDYEDNDIEQVNIKEEAKVESEKKEETKAKEEQIKKEVKKESVPVVIKNTKKENYNYSYRELFSKYVKYMLAELILKDIDLQKERKKKNKIPLRNEFTVYNFIGKLKLKDEKPEIVDYFDQLWDCSTANNYNYRLDERVEYYQKIQDEYAEILLNSDKTKNFKNKLFDDYYWTMLLEIDYGIKTIPAYNKEIGDLEYIDNTIVKEIAKNFKLPYNSDEENALHRIDSELIDNPTKEFYEELYKYLNDDCKLSLLDIKTALDKAEKEWNEKEEIESSARLISILRNKDGKVFNYIEENEDAKNLNNTLKFNIDQKSMIVEFHKVGFLGNFENMIHNGEEVEECHDFTKYVVMHDDKYVYFDEKDQKIHYCDYPAFFIKMIDNEDVSVIEKNATQILGDFLNSKHIDLTGYKLVNSFYLNKQYNKDSLYELLYGCKESEVNDVKESGELSAFELMLKYGKIYRIDFEFDEY